MKLLLPLLLALSLAAEEAPKPVPATGVSIHEIVLEPSAPTATTLCRLKVKLGNTHEQPVSMLRFAVKVSGQDLTVYGNQVFLQAIPAGGNTELKLYNFWVSETGRAAPADGKLTVEVTLLEAQKMKIGPDAEGVETWEPIGAVTGLPISKSISVPLKK